MQSSQTNSPATRAAYELHLTTPSIITVTKCATIAAKQSRIEAADLETGVGTAHVLRTHTHHCDPNTLTTTAPGIWRLPRALVFHVLNAALGVAAWLAVMSTLVLSLALMPLCGLGVVVFQVFTVVVETLARYDVAVANLIVFSADSDELLRMHPSISSEFTVRAGRLDSENWFVETPSPIPSTRMLLAAAYFASVKLVSSALSLAVVAFVLVFPVFTIPGTGLPDLAIAKHHFATSPVAFVVLALGIYALGLALLLLLAVLSRELTDIVCATPRQA